jgi:hypothetical protein
MWSTAILTYLSLANTDAPVRSGDTGAVSNSERGDSGQHRFRICLAQTPHGEDQNILDQLSKNCTHESEGVLRSLERENMLLGKFSLATFLLTAPVWAQYSRADMTKLAADRFDTAAKILNLRSDQAAAIRPLLQSKYVDIGQVKDVYLASAKSDASSKNASKKTAQDSLKAIDAKYNSQITTILTPEQVKGWKRMQKDWKTDIMVPKS